jgi:hypothetical protein
MRCAEMDRWTSSPANCLVFTDQNWSEPQIVTFSARALIPGTVGRDFELTAGNITLSWADGLHRPRGVLRRALRLARLHTAKRPFGDLTDTVNRPPFYQPAWWLFLAVIIPVVCIIVLYSGMGYGRGPIMSAFGVPAGGVEEKIFDFVFASVRATSSSS